MLKNKDLQGVAVDSVLLTIVKLITACLGIVITKVFSVYFSLTEYGTYSQALLVISIITSFTILGLTDATNYFYNSNIGEKQRKVISTIFIIQYIVGFFAAILIILFRKYIADFFQNDSLVLILSIVSFMPLFNNLLAMLQVLFVSIGEAKKISLRNLIMSLVKLIIVVFAALFIKSITFVLALQLITDFFQIIYFFLSFGRKKFLIKLKDFDLTMVRSILKFGIPMMVFISTSTLIRDIDKYIINFFSDTETLAIYSNASKVLPFDIIVASFMTVFIPIITRKINEKKFDEVKDIFKEYLRIGYLSTWLLISAVLICSKETMLFLYDDKYLSGLNVFIIYLFVDSLRFCNTSIILSASGKTKTLMVISILILILDFGLNIAFYKIFGIIGPAIATLLLTFISSLLMMWISSKVIKTSVLQLFNLKELLLFFLQILILGAVFYVVKQLLYKVIKNYFLILIIIVTLYLGINLLLSKSKILNCLKNINKI